MATKQKELTPDPATTLVSGNDPPKTPPTETTAPAGNAPENSPNRPQDISAPRTDEPTELTVAPIRKPPGAGSLASTRGVQLQTMAEMWQFSGIAFSSRMCPDAFQNREAVFIALQSGLEVGLTPMQAIQNICVINGKPSLYGPVLIALCRTKPDWVEAAYTETVSGTGDDRKATVTVQRTGGQLMTKEFSIADAKRAKLLGGPKVKDNWVSYPDDMLLARARGRALKAVFSHHLHGVSVAEEMEDIQHTRVIDYRPEQHARPQIDAVEDLAESLGVKPEPVKPIETAPVADETWAGWFRKQIAEATAPVDLDGLGAHIMQAHDQGKLTAAEANAITQELEAALERLAKR